MSAAPSFTQRRSEKNAALLSRTAEEEEPVTDAMNAPVQNPHIMYRSDPLPDTMRVKLMLLDYAPHVTDLLMQGLPITYGEQGRQVVEYPDGRRIAVKRRKVYSAEGEFQRYEFDILGELTPAAR